VQLALADVTAEVGDELVVMTDLCLDEYTDHGHCGLLTRPGRSTTTRRSSATPPPAVAQAQAGTPGRRAERDDGRPGRRDPRRARRRRLRPPAGAGLLAKYASGLLRPVPRGAECAPQFGDRSSYQQDAARPTAEGVREALLDIAEGADAVMVKPAMAYLDVVRAVADAVDVPVAAYQVSGEYAMVEAAAANGWVDRRRIVLETLTGIRRAGAGMVLTYWATEAAGWLAEP
jgi:porphobilinogen synthase